MHTAPAVSSGICSFLEAGAMLILKTKFSIGQIPPLFLQTNNQETKPQNNRKGKNRDGKATTRQDSKETQYSALIRDG